MNPQRKKLLTASSRRLVDGSTVSDRVDGLVASSIVTRCPAKWLAVDLENAQVWAFDDEGQVIRAASAQETALAKVVEILATQSR